MSDKYLFNKEGSDPDIELFEGMLSAYRIEPVAPSLSRANLKPVRSRGLLRFRLSYIPAVAALFLVMIGAGVVTRFFGHREIEITASSAPEVVMIEPDSSVASLPAVYAGKDSEPTIPVKGLANRRRTVTAEVRKTHYRTPAIRGQFAATKLTPEEKYAYQQVLVALWITGSKLKVVQDTIDRVGEENDNSASEKR
jgi:hypothetical protein